MCVFVSLCEYVWLSVYLPACSQSVLRSANVGEFLTKTLAIHLKSQGCLKNMVTYRRPNQAIDIEWGGSLMGAQSYTKNCRKLTNAESRKSFLQGRDSLLVIQHQVVTLKSYT